VRFALSGVRHVGGKAAELIVKEREKHGPYEDLLDFLVRNRGIANRKAVESLIQAGAFDAFDANRSRLLAGLDREMARAGSDRLRQSELQTDLFAAEPGAAPPAPEVRFDTHQLLSFEKQAFGFYFSSHPLEPWRAEYAGLGLFSIGRLGERRDGDAVAVGGVITARRMRKDRRDKQYAIVTLEDFDDSVEVMVFSDQLEKHRELLHPDRLAIVQGRVKIRDEVGIPQLWADRVLSFEAAERLVKAVIVAMPPESDSERCARFVARLERLRELAPGFPGEAKLYFRRAGATGRPRLAWAREYQLRPANRFLLQLRALFGEGAVEVRGELPPVESDYRRRRNAPPG